MPHERCVIAFLSNQSVIGFYICLMKYIEREPGHIQKSEYQREYMLYIIFDKNQEHSKQCWVVLTQIWVKY